MSNLLDYKTPQEGIEKLRQHVILRNSMITKHHWGIVNDECVALANKLEEYGTDIALVTDILESTTTTKPTSFTDNPTHDPTYDPNKQG
jgi:hypothetical protein